MIEEESDPILEEESDPILEEENDPGNSEELEELLNSIKENGIEGAIR